MNNQEAVNMQEYHKIQTVFKRDPATKHKTLLEGEYSLPEFEYLAGNRWIWTEKVDGTNIRIHYDHGTVRLGGRADAAQVPATLINAINNLLPVESMSEVLGDSCLTLYGEGYGPKIQKVGGLYRDTQSFVLFDVRVGHWWLRRDAVEGIADQLGLDVVPIVGSGTLLEMVEAARSGVTSTWGNFQSEGYVARPEVELQGRNGQRIITKIKCKDFSGGTN